MTHYLMNEGPKIALFEPDIPQIQLQLSEHVRV